MDDARVLRSEQKVRSDDTDDKKWCIILCVGSLITHVQRNFHDMPFYPPISVLLETLLQVECNLSRFMLGERCNADWWSVPLYHFCIGAESANLAWEPKSC